MQIRTRLTLQFMVVVAFIIAFSFGVVYYSSSLYRQKELYQRLENKANTCAEIFFSAHLTDAKMLSIFERTQKDKLPLENISIYNANGIQLYTNNDSINFKLNDKLFNEIKFKGRKEFTENKFEVLGITINDTSEQFIVIAGAIDIFGYSKLQNLRRTLLILFVIIISILAIAGWIYAGRALRPLSNVVNEVDEITTDKLNKRLNKSKYNDEIGRLIATFNTLLDRIENTFNLQKLFISGASHELKNPLTSITSQLQVVMLNDRSNEEYKTIIKSILEDIKNLNKTTADLIEFSRLNYENKIQTNDVRIDDVLWICSDYFKKTNHNYQVSIAFNNIPEDSNLFIINGNEALLKLAFINLIDNACKFSSNQTCYVTIEVLNNRILVSFTDSGIGLSTEEIKLIYEPFYRSNSTTETKGHGIGLALTKKVIQLHEAEILVESQKGVGTKFSIEFQTKKLDQKV